MCSQPGNEQVRRTVVEKQTVRQRTENKWTKVMSGETDPARNMNH